MSSSSSSSCGGWLSSSSLSPSLRALLHSHGFASTAQVRRLSPSQLSKELNLPLLEALHLLQTLQPRTSQPQQPPLSLLPSSSPTPLPSTAAEEEGELIRTEKKGEGETVTAAALLPSFPPPFPSAGVCYPSALSLFSLRCGSAPSPPTPSLLMGGGAVGGSGGGGGGEGGGGGSVLTALTALTGAAGLRSRSVFTLCRSLDGLLGDGVQLGELTEFVGSPGLGKCFGRGVRLRQFNGETIAVEDISGGETLMGDDGLPRTVTPGSLTQGRAPLYRIDPHWTGAEPFTVNGDHVLVLVNPVRPTAVPRDDGGGWLVMEWAVSAGHRLVRRRRQFSTQEEAEDEVYALIAAGWEPLEWEVSVDDFLRSSEEVHSSCQLLGSAAVTFTNPLEPSLHQRLTIELGQPPSTAQLGYVAWSLGIALSDGASPSISPGAAPSPDRQPHHRLLARLQHFTAAAAQLSAHVSAAAVGRIVCVYAYDLTRQSPHRIPRALICDSLYVRRCLLAGLLDSAGEYNAEDEVYHLSAEQLHVIVGCKELAATLGLRNSAITSHTKCTSQHTGEGNSGHRIAISGDMWEVARHCAVLDKRCLPPGPLTSVDQALSRCYGLTISPLPTGDYFGFAVDGGINRRFLLEDYTVTHNVSL